MEDKIKKRFYGHSTLKAKYIPQIPMQAEREYIRIVDSYVSILKEELDVVLDELKKHYKINRDKSVRMDDDTDILLLITKLFNSIQNRLTSRTQEFGLRRKLENIANINRKLTVKEWKKCVRATLGIDIREDYYLGDFYKENLTRWVDNNIDLITTLPHDTLGKMREIVYDGYANGKTTTSMVKMLMNSYGITKRHARLIARDQTAKLNGAIQKAQQQDAGIEEYIWSTSQDQRVRESHKQLNGKKYSWNEAPLNSDGRQCHPGEDFQCRCVARPVFNFNMNLPTEDNVEVKQPNIPQIDYKDLPTLKRSGMKESDYKDFINTVNTCENSDAIRLYRKYTDMLDSIKLTKHGGVYKHAYNELEFSYPHEAYNFNKYSTLAHELGHNMDAKAVTDNLHFDEVYFVKQTIGDWALDKRCSMSDEFLGAIRKDKDMLEKIYMNTDTMQDLRNNHESHGVQDAIDGFFGTQSKYIYSWGHGETYYNKQWNVVGKVVGTERRKKLKDLYMNFGLDASNLTKTKNIYRNYRTSVEIWANVSSAVVCGGKELEYIKKYLPNSYKTYLNILERVE